MTAITPPDWLNTEFLKKALKAEVKCYDVRTMGAAGDGFTSNFYRVNVELGTGEHQSMIIKQLVETGSAGKCMAETTMFAREAEMYEVTLSKLVSLLEKALPGEDHTFAPKYIYSCPGILVMEDLGSSGFQMLDRHQGLDLEHCLVVMRMIAKFHAASVVLQEQEPESMKLFRNSIFSEPAMADNVRNFYRCLTILFADAVATWPEYGEKYADKFRAMADKMIELSAWSARREDGRFNVLTHDDLWVNNLMFRSLSDVRMVDFQFLHFASPGNELQVFIESSVTDEVREQHVEALLKEYHTTLCDTLTALDYTKTLLTLEELKKEYDLSSMYGMSLAVTALPVVLAPPGRDIPVFESESVPPDVTIYDNSKYLDVARKMLRVYETQGAFDIAEKFYKETSL